MEKNSKVKEASYRATAAYEGAKRRGDEDAMAAAKQRRDEAAVAAQEAADAEAAVKARITKLKDQIYKLER